MKIFATIYTSMNTAQLVDKICLAAWKMTKVSDHEFSLQATGVNLTVEGQGDILIHGEFLIPLIEIDQWAEKFKELPISYTIDIHEDEARLVRRYQ